jgi:hypothetical protein
MRDSGRPPRASLSTVVRRELGQGSGAQGALHPWRCVVWPGLGHSQHAKADGHADVTLTSP